MGRNILNERKKKKIIAIELAILLLVSIIVVYINLDKLENVYSQPAVVTSQDDSSEQDKVLDSIAENVTEMFQQLDESLVLGYLEKLMIKLSHYIKLHIRHN